MLFGSFFCTCQDITHSSDSINPFMSIWVCYALSFNCLIVIFSQTGSGDWSPRMQTPMAVLMLSSNPPKLTKLR